MKKTLTSILAILVIVVLAASCVAETKEEMLNRAAQEMLGNATQNGSLLKHEIPAAHSIPELESRSLEEPHHNMNPDEAAGLRISEKMRGQIRGLDQASTNAQDGISMVQTAEGALNETTAILQRMRELTVQVAETDSEEMGRESHSEEISQLEAEIERISQQEEFRIRIELAPHDVTPTTLEVEVELPQANIQHRELTFPSHEEMIAQLHSHH